jgi:hypothetical protein
MDPYLEEPGLWPDVHHELISVARELLNKQLRPKYHVRIEERVYLSDENDPGRQVIIPDVRVAGADQGARMTTAREATTGGAAVAEPVELTTLIEDEIHEARLEVIDRDQRSVVTVIEILSPANKIPGSRGRASYQQKRAEVMNSSSHFVEIDLLRSGAALAARELVPPADYYVHVSRKSERPKGLVWPIQLPQRLPVVPVPLLVEDGQTPLDLQQVLATAYDRAGYDLQIDYNQEADPPLPEKYRQWAGEVLGR